jgi:hypothetical protein
MIYVNILDLIKIKSHFIYNNFSAPRLPRRRPRFTGRAGLSGSARDVCE